MMIETKTPKVDLDAMSREELIDELLHIEWHIAMTLEGQFTMEELTSWFMARNPAVESVIKDKGVDK